MPTSQLCTGRSGASVTADGCRPPCEFSVFNGIVYQTFAIPARCLTRFAFRPLTRLAGGDFFEAGDRGAPAVHGEAKFAGDGGSGGRRRAAGENEEPALLAEIEITAACWLEIGMKTVGLH